MIPRICKVVGTDEWPLLAGIIEIDETYVGGKPRKTQKMVTVNTLLISVIVKLKKCVVGPDCKVKAKHMNNKKQKGIDFQEFAHKILM